MFFYSSQMRARSCAISSSILRKACDGLDFPHKWNLKPNNKQTIQSVSSRAYFSLHCWKEFVTFDYLHQVSICPQISRHLGFFQNNKNSKIAHVPISSLFSNRQQNPWFLRVLWILAIALSTQLFPLIVLKNILHIQRFFRVLIIFGFSRE